MLINIKKISFLNPKILILFILSLFVAGFIFPQHSKAAVPVFDVVDSLITATNLPIQTALQTSMVKELAILNTMQASQHLKEVGTPPWPPALSAVFGGAGSLDSFGWIIAKIALSTLMQQVVQWVRTGNINSGPLFVTDWEKFLLNASDKASGLFLQELGLTNLCQPFSAPMKRALSNNVIGRGTPFNMRAACTMGNMQAFLNDSQGGAGWLDQWETLTQDSNNNPYTAYALGIAALSVKRDSAIQKNQDEALASLGLLGTKTCEPATIETEAGDQPLGENCTITSPGKAVETELSKVLQTNLENLNLADELDETLAALLKSLLQNMLFSIGGILSGDTSGSITPPQPPATPPTCGDGVCASSESSLSCPADCGSASSPSGNFTIISPLNGGSFINSVQVTAFSGSVANISSVQFTLDGTNTGAPVTGTGNFDITIDLSAVSEGPHILGAIALNDSGGQIAQASSISISIDRTSPVINNLRTSDNPLGLRGSTNIFADASDGGNKTAVTVEFFINGSSIGQGTLNNGSFRLQNWDTKTFINGSYQLTARATDKAGNTAITPPLTIVINN